MVFASGLLISIILARGLGPKNLGLYATLITIAAVTRLFSDLGLEKILNIKLPAFAVKEGGKRKIRFLVQRIVLVRGITIGVLAFFLWLLYPAIIQLLKRPELEGFHTPVVLYFSISVFISLFYMLHQSLLKIKTVSLVDGGEKLTTLMLLTIFFALGFKVRGALFAYIISGGMAALILFFLGRDLIWGESEKEDTRDLTKIGLTAVIYGFVSMGLGSQVDILLMNWFMIPTEDIGFYHLGFNLAVMLGLFSQGIGSISQSVFSEAFTRGGNSGLGVAWQMVTKVFMLMAIPFYIFALWYAPSICKVFYGEEYLNASGILRIFIISTTIRIIVGSSFCMSAFFLIHQKRRGVSIQIAGGVVNVVLDLILIPFYGVWGAVIATSCSLVLTGLGQTLTLAYKIGMFPPLVFAGKILFACVCGLLPTLFFTVSSISMCALAGILYGLVFLITMSVLRPLGEAEKEMVRVVNPQLAVVVKYF